MDILLTVIEKYGFMVGVIVFFIYRDAVREKRLSDRIEKLESYQTETLAKLVQRATEALVENTEVIKSLRDRR